MLLFGLLLTVLLLRNVQGGGEFYARHLYPAIGKVLSSFSDLFPFSVNDLFIAFSIGWLIVYPVLARTRRHRDWRTILVRMAEYLAWVYVWFYAAWGINYAQPNIYQRLKMSPAAVTTEEFRSFAYRYADSINACYRIYRKDGEQKQRIRTGRETPLKKEELGTFVLTEYQQMNSRGMGVNAPFCEKMSPKTMVFSRFSAMAGVTGSMGPFFCEFTLNSYLLPHDYPFTYAHEYAHRLGIANEGEANFYAYQVCTASPDGNIRYSAYYHLLGHVLNDVYAILGEKEYEVYWQHLDKGIIRMAEADRAYWKEMRIGIVDRLQGLVYEAYLRGNKVKEGRRSYSTVIRMLMAWEKKQKEVRRCSF